MNKLKDKLKKRGMTQEALEKRFTLLRTMMAISIGIVLSIVIIVIVSDDPAAGHQVPADRTADEPQ